MDLEQCFPNFNMHTNHISQISLLLSIFIATILVQVPYISHFSPGQVSWPSDAQPCDVGLVVKKPGEGN